MFFEKVCFDANRTYYAAGEELWFEAYLVNEVYIQPQISRTGALMYVVHLSLLPGAFVYHFYNMHELSQRYI